MITNSPSLVNPPWRPNQEDLAFRPHDFLLVRFRARKGKLLGPSGQLVDFAEHRHAVGFQTEEEADRFIRQKAWRHRGRVFLTTRSELLQSVLDET